MVRILERMRIELRKPLGKVHKSIRAVRMLSKNHRIISVGDVCTLALLDTGIRPHLAVFDFRYMRRKLKTQDISRLKTAYPRPRIYSNPAGTVSDRLIADAGRLLEEGGAILIHGEEDLTALAFILAADDRDIIVYGQPNEGMVVVRMDEKLKERIREIISQ